METKVCSKCNNTYSIDNFAWRKDTNKYRNHCRHCVKKRSKLYVEKNKERLNKLMKKYYQKHREELLKYAEEWRLNNKERIKKNSERYTSTHKKEKREYMRKNKEKFYKLNREYHKNNKEQVNKRKRKYMKKRIKEDVQYKIKTMIRKRIQSALKVRKIVKSDSSIKLLGCSWNFYKEYMEARFKKGMSWENWGKHIWHIDHIKPLASFDLTDPKEQKKAFHYSNTQPLWAKENLSKGAKF